MNQSGCALVSKDLEDAITGFGWGVNRSGL